MSGEAIAIVGALFGTLTGLIVILTLRVLEIRERLGRLEEWVRQRERDMNHRSS